MQPFFQKSVEKLFQKSGSGNSDFFFWSTTFLKPEFSNQISRTIFLKTLFYTFLEKWLQIKWSSALQIVFPVFFLTTYDGIFFAKTCWISNNTGSWLTAKASCKYKKHKKMPVKSVPSLQKLNVTFACKNRTDERFSSILQQ